MKHYLNVCDVNGAAVTPVDIITFGSPCQDLSVAGKRAGLKHEDKGDEETTRSGLFMEAVRIIKEMREATNGRYPTFALWENVLGAFSSNGGEDFRTVLEELAKISDETVFIPEPPKGKWTTAGCVDGDGWSIAWRTLDAQHFGVPQRRRRILLVADFAGGRAHEILFKPESMRGYPSASREAWKGTPADTAGSVGGNVALAPVASTLRAGAGAPKHMQDITGRLVLTRTPYADIVLNDQGGQQVDARTDGKSPTLRAEMHGNIPAVIQPKTYAVDMGGGKSNCGIIEEQSPTLTCTHGGAPAIAIQGSMIGRADKNGPMGDGVNEDKCFTLNTADRHAVAYSIGAYNSEGMLSSNPKAGIYEADTSRTLDPNGGNPTCNQGGLAIVEVKPRYIVRRLTPTECARLQGFPDDWGHVSKKDDMTEDEVTFWNNVYLTHQKIVNGKTVQPKTKAQLLTWYNRLWNDGSEYKMWGNGVALPCVRVPLHGMAAFGAKTLASLFDGSGGFPLAGTLEGIDPMWCSEIEPYPIAVTVERFPELTEEDLDRILEEAGL